MKIIAKIFFILIFGNSIYCQNSDINILHDTGLSVTLRFLDNNYGLFIYKWNSSKEFRLIKFELKNDTLYMQDSNDEITVSIEKFYGIDSTLPKDYLSIKSEFTHLYAEGRGSYVGFNYNIDGNKHTPEKSDDMEHLITIKELRQDFSVIIKTGEYPSDTCNVHFPEGHNTVKIVFTQILSTHGSVVDMRSNFPKQVNNHGVNYILQWKD